MMQEKDLINTKMVLQKWGDEVISSMRDILISQNKVASGNLINSDFTIGLGTGGGGGAGAASSSAGSGGNGGRAAGGGGGAGGTNTGGLSGAGGGGGAGFCVVIEYY